MQQPSQRLVASKMNIPIEPAFKREPARALHCRRAARLVAAATRFPAAGVTFNDEAGRQRLVTDFGVAPADRDLFRTCCEETASKGGIHVKGNLYFETPSALGNPRFSFFAGIALRLHDTIGVLGVMGPSSTPWVPASQIALREVHSWLEDTLEAMRITRTDHLTGLANRREIEEVLGREWRRASREYSPVSVLSIDIDHFKGFNDTYGHPLGDAALQAVSGALRSALKRPGDVVGRIGGEEFLACLPSTDTAGALETAERMRRAVEDLRIPHAGSPRNIVTISIGAATALIPLPGDDQERPLVAAAHRARYQAKSAGRNTVDTAELPGEVHFLLANEKDAAIRHPA